MNRVHEELLRYGLKYNQFAPIMDQMNTIPLCLCPGRGS